MIPIILFLFMIPWFSKLAYADSNNRLNICSNQNTGSSNKVHVSVFQTIGLCSNTCQGYAYGIVQGKSCWCSNYAPGTKSDVSDCSEECPGFPDDKCGNEDKNLFGYILLATPSGTQEVSSSTTSTSSTSTTSTKSSSPTPSTKTATVTSSLTKNSIKSTQFVSVYTQTGKVHTMTVTQVDDNKTKSTATSTSIPNSSNGGGNTGGGGSSSDNGSSTNDDNSGNSSAVSNQSKSNDGNDGNDSFFDDKGKVAGVFTAVGVAAFGMVGAAFFFLLRRKYRVKHAEDGTDSPTSFFDGKLFRGDSGSSNMKRDQSTATTLAGLGFDEPHPIPTRGRNGETIVPITVDQRLDPGQVFMRWDQNDSRRSLQDQHDYSRKVLRVTNPDNNDYA